MILFCSILNGCEKTTTPVILAPPRTLLNDCSVRNNNLNIYKSSNLNEYIIAITELNVDYETALALCNADKAALREWYKRATKEVKDP